METTAKFKPNVEIATDAEELALHAVDLFYATVDEALDSRGVFYMALSGGGTPRRTFELMADSAKAQSVAWRDVHVFWVDERYVPYDSSASNFRLVDDALLSKIPIPPENIHPIPTGFGDINTAAQEYESTLRNAFGLESDRVPQFDLVVLGMGVDGHTASLMPNSYATFDTGALVSVVYALGDKLNRITLTHPVLCAARRLAVLVSGPEKANTLRDVLTGEPDEVRFPIHVLWPVLDKVTWFVDRDAAQTL